MARIAFLGMGAMGSRMARACAVAGHAVCVWNRSADRLAGLDLSGMERADSPRAAAAGADFVIAMVRDDAAARRVWLDPVDGALAGMGADALAIECSTLGLATVRALGARFAQAGHGLIDAPVVGSRPQADAGQLIFLAGGDAEAVARATTFLSAMGSAVHHAGPQGSGMALKLAVNALFGIQVCAMAEIDTLLRRNGLDPALALPVLAATPVCSPAAAIAAKAMQGDAFPPLFPVELVAKDFACALQATDRAPLIAAAAAVFDQALAAGLGHDNLTGVVRLYRAKS